MNDLHNKKNNSGEDNEDIEFVEESAAAPSGEETFADEDGSEKKMKKLRDNLKRCEEEKKNYLDGWQRAKADHINYKNEEGKRLEDLGRFMTTSLIQDIIPVLDSFDLALTQNVSKEVEKGILLIRSQCEEVLKKRGLQPIKVEIGEEFNPEKHESIGEVTSDVPQGMIAEEMQKGYMLRDRVLRPVRIRIAK